MLKLGVFKLSDLQSCLSLLNEFEGAGITDTRIVKQRIHDTIYQDRRVGTVARAKKEARDTNTIDTANMKSALPCPECQDGRVVRLKIDGVEIELCVTKKSKAGCGYSRMVA